MSISLHDEFAKLNLYIKYEPRTIYEKVSYSKINPEYKDVDGQKFSETHKDLITFIDALPYDKPNIDIQQDEIFKYDHPPKEISTNPEAPPIPILIPVDATPPLAPVAVAVAPPPPPTQKILRLPLISTGIYVHAEFNNNLIENYMALVKDNININDANIITEICLYDAKQETITKAEAELLKFDADKRNKFAIKSYGVLGIEKNGTKTATTANCIIVDPAGSAFTFNDKCQTYSGEGGSKAIYKFFRIYGKYHNLKKIDAGYAKFNNLANTVFDNKNDCDNKRNNIFIDKKGALGIIHAVGPDGSVVGGLTIGEFKDKLGNTLKTISNLLNNHNYIKNPILTRKARQTHQSTRKTQKRVPQAQQAQQAQQAPQAQQAQAPLAQQAQAPLAQAQAQAQQAQLALARRGAHARRGAP